MCGSIDAYSHRFNGPVIREKSSALPELTMYRARAVPQPASEGQAITLCCSQVHPSTVRVRCSARAVVSEECLEGTVDGFLNLSIHDERAADSQEGIDVRAYQHRFRAYRNWPHDFEGEGKGDDRDGYAESRACRRIDRHRRRANANHYFGKGALGKNRYSVVSQRLADPIPDWLHLHVIGCDSD